MRSLRALIALVPLLLGALLAALLASPAGARDRLVVGGRPVSAAKHPWVVALTSRARFGDTRSGQFCGGALVGARTVITAAHCLSRQVLGAGGGDVRDMTVVSGRSRLQDKSGHEVGVSKVWVDPDFDKRTNANDIAVLTLATPLPERDTVKMAESGDPAYRAGTKAQVYGWGDTTGTGRYASGLRAADVGVMPDSACAEAYPEGGTNGAYQRGTMLCAGVRKGGRDACQGDSGGPLVARGRLVGLVSWGAGCGQRGRPGVYTRISVMADLVRAHD